MLTENILMSNSYSEHFDNFLKKLGDRDPHTRIFGHLIIRSLLSLLSGRNQIEAAYRVLQVLDLGELTGDVPSSKEPGNVSSPFAIVKSA